METMRKYILAGMVLLPSMVIAGTDCRVVEYADHYDLVCVGDEKSGPVRPQEAVAAQAPVTAPASVASKDSVVTTQTSAEAPLSAPAVITPATQTDARSPYVIGQHRPDRSVRNAARASRARLIQEERQKQPDNPIGTIKNLPDMNRD